MTFSQLRDHIKAEVCSFLDFNDINKLTQTNKRTQLSLKSYKLDKPKIHILKVYLETRNLGDRYVECSMKIEEHGEIIDLPRIEYRVDKDIHTPKIANLINKFYSIEQLDLCDMDLNEFAGWEHSIETKIGRGLIDSVRFLSFSKGTILDFFKQFKHIEFNRSWIEEENINDELYTELSNSGTILRLVDYSAEVDVTDATLASFTKIQIPKELCLQGLTTNITFGAIKQIMEAALVNGISGLEWNFGILKQDQYSAVQACVQDDYVQWNIGMNPPLCLDTQDPKDTGIEYYYMLHPDYDITIGVEVPEEDMQKYDSMEDTDSGDEDPMNE